MFGNSRFQYVLEEDDSYDDTPDTNIMKDLSRQDQIDSI